MVLKTGSAFVNAGCHFSNHTHTMKAPKRGLKNRTAVELALDFHQLFQVVKRYDADIFKITIPPIDRRLTRHSINVTPDIIRMVGGTRFEIDASDM